MKARRTIHISAVRAEFSGLLPSLTNDLRAKGCYVTTAGDLKSEPADLEEALRTSIRQADAVIFLIGQRLGPLSTTKDRRGDILSIAQLEYHIADELARPMYLFGTSNGPFRDAGQAYPDREAEHLRHRQVLFRIQEHFFDRVTHWFKTPEELRAMVNALPVVQDATFQVDVSRVARARIKHLVGRRAQLDTLDMAWKAAREGVAGAPHMAHVLGQAGMGKTALLACWLDKQAQQEWPECDAAYAWSFDSGGQGKKESTGETFVNEALTFFGAPDLAASPTTLLVKGERLAELVGKRRTLIVLDGLEVLLETEGRELGRVKDPAVYGFLTGLEKENQGLCVIASRVPVETKNSTAAQHLPLYLPPLSDRDSAEVLESLRAYGSAEQKQALFAAAAGVPLSLRVMGEDLRRQRELEHEAKKRPKVSSPLAAEQPTIIIPEGRGVAISYRRDDSAYASYLVYRELCTRFGPQCVFFDLDSIRPGTDYRKHLMDTFESVTVVLAIIGPRWIGTKRNGQYRIFEEDDWVKRELSTAFQKGKEIIPVLLKGTRMPKRFKLPSEIQSLCDRQAVELRPGKDFVSDFHRLVTALKEMLV